jgi:hypothetical protein
VPDLNAGARQIADKVERRADEDAGLLIVPTHCVGSRA